MLWTRPQEPVPLLNLLVSGTSPSFHGLYCSSLLRMHSLHACISFVCSCCAWNGRSNAVAHTRTHAGGGRSHQDSARSVCSRTGSTTAKTKARHQGATRCVSIDIADIIRSFIHPFIHIIDSLIHSFTSSNCVCCSSTSASEAKLSRVAIRARCQRCAAA